MSLEFENLPLIEVALRRVFRTPLPLNLPFITEVNKHLESAGLGEYMDLDSYEEPPGVNPLVHLPGKVSGCQFRNMEDGVTTVLQSDMVVARWSSAHNLYYPRYSRLKEAADRMINAINLAGYPPLEFQVSNMAYANRIEISEGEGVMPANPWPLSENWTQPQVRSHEQIYESHTLIRSESRSIDKRLVFRRMNDNPDWYLLLTVAGKTIEVGEMLNDAESEVHEELCDWFTDVLSDEAKNRFGLKS